jgi:peptide-methionine (S)-S-oxide reductase
MERRLLLAVLLLAACSSPPSTSAPAPATASRARGTAADLEAGQAEAIFAGGCFWCMERAFEGVPGVLTVTSGYTGGTSENPNYEEVSGGQSGHYEAVRVVYDPARVTYRALLELFVTNVDPTQGNGQFCDLGEQYLSGIFVRNAEERALAEAALTRARGQLGTGELATFVREAGPFWVAEEYHQDYYRKNPERYASYAEGCRRAARLRQLWGPGSAH